MGNALVTAVLELILSLLGLYKGILIVSVILSWLVNFDVVNPRNRFVSMIGDFCYRVTEPALRPIRRYLPSMNGLDLAPLVLFAFIWLTQRTIQIMAIKMVLG